MLRLQENKAQTGAIIAILGELAAKYLRHFP